VNVLALNCGSASVKFELVTVAPGGTIEGRPARGSVAPLSGPARVRLEAAGRGPRAGEVVDPGYPGAVGTILDWLAGAGLRADAVGHRVVHGGERFRESTRIDAAVVAELTALRELAPLHNAPSLEGIRAARAAFGDSMPMVAVFDTAFHAGIPEEAAAYAIPRDLARRHGIRRFGFHGTAFRSVLERYAESAGVPVTRPRLVALHLGGGCSAAAIRDGRSVETSMGFTPLEGLVMGSRSGDLDPAVVAHIAQRESLDVEEVLRVLNEESGLRGLSGRSGDVRDLLEREKDDPAARLALAAFCHRARKYLGAYLAVLGGADAVVWSGGIGENAPAIRERIASGMEWLGLRLDTDRNRAAVGVESEIGERGSPIRALVIPADEARIIARDTAACLS